MEVNCHLQLHHCQDMTFLQCLVPSLVWSQELFTLESSEGHSAGFGFL